MSGHNGLFSPLTRVDFGSFGSLDNVTSSVFQVKITRVESRCRSPAVRALEKEQEEGKKNRNHESSLLMNDALFCLLPKTVLDASKSHIQLPLRRGSRKISRAAGIDTFSLHYFPVNYRVTHVFCITSRLVRIGTANERRRGRLHSTPPVGA